MNKMSRRERKAYKFGKRIGYIDGYSKGLYDGNPFNKIAEACKNMIDNVSKVMSNPEIQELVKAQYDIAKEDDTTDEDGVV